MAKGFFQAHETARMDELDGLQLADFGHRAAGFLVDFLLVALLYYVVVHYCTNGKSVGKWIARTRIVSLTHERLGLWQCIERVLGYGVSTAEGIGFLQY